MSLEASLKLSIAAILNGAGDLSTKVANINKVYTQTYADGTGANQAERIFADTRTLAASTGEDIDLSGALTDILGDAVVFTAIKAIIIKAAAGNTNAVEVTTPASNGFPRYLAAGDGESLSPGDVSSWFSGSAAGKAVTAGTGDLLHVANAAAGSSVDYDIIIIGNVS